MPSDPTTDTPADGTVAGRIRHPLLTSLRIGGLAWAVVVGLGIGSARLGITEVALAFAPTIVAPIGVDLLRIEDGSFAARLYRLGATAVPIGAIAAAAAVLLPARGLSVILASTWFLVTEALCIAAILRWWANGRRLSAVQIGPVLALGYLQVGAMWLVVDRLAWRPLSLAPEIVELTAVHFHYAGFAAAIIALATLLAVPEERRALPRAMAWLTFAGPPLVALGFAVWRPLQVVGAIVIAAGLLGVAHVLFWWVRPAVATTPARLLLTVAALAVVAPMLLAVHWAIAANVGWPALSIPWMARTHGALNAFGFSFLGLAGWRLLGRLPPEPPGPVSPPAA